MASHALPAEITELIIDCSAPKTSALRSCSLTCRQWRPRAQYHLLSSICISDDHFPDFADFITRCPERAACVACVEIIFSVSYDDAISQLHPLLGVHRLRLSSRNFISRRPVGIKMERLAVVFPNVTAFSLHDIDFTTPGTTVLMSAITRFPALRSLEVGRFARLYWENGYTSTEVLTQASAPLSLGSLSLNVWCTDMCTLFAARNWQDVRMLRRLALDFPMRWNSSQLFVDLLVHVLSTLHELMLNTANINHYIGTTPVSCHRRSLHTTSLTQT